jgi:diamine N-acetyltransferase
LDGIIIRPGEPSDASTLAELAARTFQDTFAADNRPEDMAVHVSQAYGPLQQGRELADPNVATLLADTGNGLAGYAQLRRGPAPACVEGESPIELWRFYIDREWHGRGLAQKLMQRVDLDARRMGARTMWLGVWERNERAKAFYRKCGFVDVGSHTFMLGSDVQTDRVWTRPIPPDASQHAGGS